MLSLFEPILASIAEDDKKKSNVVIKNNVSSIDRKAKLNQLFKYEGQGHTIFVCPKCRNMDILAYLNQNWQVL